MQSAVIIGGQGKGKHILPAEKISLSCLTTWLDYILTTLFVFGCFRDVGWRKVEGGKSVCSWFLVLVM